MTRRWFTGREAALLIVIGIVTAFADHRIERVVFGYFFDIPAFVSLSNSAFNLTGGPVLGDLLMAWEQYGAVLAAYLVRRPGSGTLAMTANGIAQVLLNGTHAPHLLYGVAGLGADMVFAFFRYGNYNLRASALAGLAAGMFWYPVVYFSHAVFQYPVTFVISDLAVRAMGNMVGNGLLGVGLGVIVLTIARRTARSAPPSKS